jgi:hypothetical protein
MGFPPYVKNVATTILTTLLPARHNFVWKFYTEFDENQTSGFAAHYPGLISVKTQIIFYSFYFRCGVCVLTDTIFVKLVTEYLIETSHTSKLFCHRYLGRKSAGCCLHTRRIFGYRRNARDCSTRITTKQHVLPPQAGTCRRAAGSVYLELFACLSLCLLTPVVSTFTDR